jgi:hypothetical protein
MLKESKLKRQTKIMCVYVKKETCVVVEAWMM